VPIPFALIDIVSAIRLQNYLFTENTGTEVEKSQTGSEIDKQSLLLPHKHLSL
jgi:hypothetical protein